MEPRKTNPSRNHALSGLHFLHVLNDGWLASLPLLLPFVQKDLHIGFGEIGLLTGMLGLAGVVLALPSASISKRFGGYRVLAFAVLLYSLSFAMTGFAKSSGYLLAAFAVGSIGFGLFHPIGFALVAHGSGANELGRKMGGFTAVGDIGRIAVSAATTVSVSLLSWRCTAFLYCIIPILLVSVLIAVTQKSAMWKAAESAPDKAHGLRLNARFVLAIVSGFIDSFASSSLFVFIPFLYLLRGSSTVMLGSLSGAYFIGNMLGKVLAGRITDAFGSRKVFICSELLMCALLIGLSLAEYIPLMALLSVLLGAVTKGTVPVLNTIIVHSVADKRLIDRAFSIGSFVNGIASVMAPVLLGFVSERFGLVRVFQASACFALAAIIPMAIRSGPGRRDRLPFKESGI